MNEEPQNPTAAQNPAPIPQPMAYQQPQAYAAPTQSQQPYQQPAIASDSAYTDPSQFKSKSYGSYGFGGSRMGGRFSGLFLIIFGLIFGGGGYAVMRVSAIPASYQRVSGQVTQVVPVYGTTTDNNGFTRRTTTYAPVISYKVSGTAYSFQASNSSSSQPIVGSSVVVAYDPSNPSHSPKDASDHSAKIVAPIFMGLGGVIALLGLYKLIKG